MQKRDAKAAPPPAPVPLEGRSGGKRSARQVGPLARRHAEAAVAALVAVMNDAEAAPAARVSAASALLNWAYGKTATERKDAAGAKAPSVKVIKLRWSDERTKPRGPGDMPGLQAHNEE